MIKLVANNYVKEEYVEEFLELAAELVKESRKEEGCLSYLLYEDTTDKTHLTFIEEWKSDDAIVLHCNSNHFTSTVPKLSGLCYKEGVLDKYREVKFV